MKRTQTQRVVVLIVLISTLAISLFLVLYSDVPKYENTASIQKTTQLSLVLPTKLPSGSTITSQPTHQTKTDVTTTVLSVRDKQVTISQQKRPPIDLKQLDAQETYLVEAGAVYILKGEADRLQAIIETKDSWVIVNAPENIGLSTFKEIVASLGNV